MEGSGLIEYRFESRELISALPFPTLRYHAAVARDIITVHGPGSQPLRAFDLHGALIANQPRERIATCAVGITGGNWPLLRLRGSPSISPSARPLEAFEREFMLECRDRRFVSALLDPALAAYLVDVSVPLHLVARNRYLLIITPPGGVADTEWLVEFCQGVLERIPPAVDDLYPTAQARRGVDPLAKVLAGADAES